MGWILERVAEVSYSPAMLNPVGAGNVPQMTEDAGVTDVRCG